jgi:hypothetical protein
VVAYIRTRWFWSRSVDIQENHPYASGNAVSLAFL